MARQSSDKDEEEEMGEGGDARVPDSSTGPSVSVKFWSPDTPYLRALKEANVDHRYSVYLEQREEYLDTPAFYMDCGHYFYQNHMIDMAIRCITNITELKLESHELLRILGYLLDQFDNYELAALVFEKVLKLRPFEPQSYRDLALVLEQKGDFQRAIDLLWEVVIGTWDSSFAEIELTCLYELNAIVARCQGFKDQGVNNVEPVNIILPARLGVEFLNNLHVDVRISLAWDTDNTDMDLHVIEPTGEEAYYSHNRTGAGGMVSRDFTRGYGPEEYMIKVSPKGTYNVKTNYFSSSNPSLTGPTTLLLHIFTNFGRPNQVLYKSVIRLAGEKDNDVIGSITWN